MKSTNEILVNMVDLADFIMSMCGGDAWERECTEDARNEYCKLRDELDRELKRGKYSPDVIAKQEADDKARANEILAGCAIDCPVCGQRLHMVGLHDHVKSCHNSDAVPTIYKMDKLIQYCLSNGLSCRLVPISKKTIQKARKKADGYVKPITIKDLYHTAKMASIGVVVVCPSCHGEFVKKTKDQAFCSTNGRMCKDRYWNFIRR